MFGEYTLELTLLTFTLSFKWNVYVSQHIHIYIYWPIYSISHHNKLCTFIWNCRFLEFWNILSWYLIKGSHKIYFLKVKTLLSNNFRPKTSPKLFEKKFGPSCLTYLPSKNLSKFFFLKKYGVNRPYLPMIWRMS